MDAKQRRKEIVNILNTEEEPISGSKFAEIFNVTRQVIVQDIAILRASGEDIIATSRGYLIRKPVKLFTKKIAVCHNEDKTKEELMTFIQCGCKVRDVIIEHPIYGELRGMLMLNDSSDVDDFILKTKKHEAVLLSKLTHGVHLHTVEGLNEECIKRAETILKEKGILLD